MIRKMKLYLPIVQVSLAAVLLGANKLRWSGWAYPLKAPEVTLCYGINAPATVATWFLARFVLFRTPVAAYHLVRPFIQYWLYVPLVWALWYAFAVEVCAKQGNGSVLTPLTRLRGIADTVLIVWGTILFVYATGTPGNIGPWNGSNANEFLFRVPTFFWSVAIIWFYGRDLGSCVKGALMRHR